MYKKQPTILIVGGGTGGHFFPALAVARELKTQRPKFKILFLGSGKKWEKNAAQKAKVSYMKIISGKLRRYWSWKNFADGFKFMIGIFQSLHIMIWRRPGLVFSKGGYVSLPAVLAARILGIPIFVHESDTRLGFANRIASRFAQKVFLGFPVKYYKNTPIERSVYSGIPIQSEFFDQGKKIEKNINSKLDERKKFGFSLKTAVILISGGSQGARFINEITSKIIHQLLSKYQIIHLSGEKDFKLLSSQRDGMQEGKKQNYYLSSFIDNDKMAGAMATSDLIISRAGANGLAEFSVLGKPSILIPLESDGHQEENGKIYAREGAAVLLKENTITPTSLLEIINRLLEDKKELEAMGRKARSLANPEAAESIVEEIIKFAIIKLR